MAKYGNTFHDLGIMDATLALQHKSVAVLQQHEFRRGFTAPASYSLSRRRTQSRRVGGTPCVCLC